MRKTIFTVKELSEATGYTVAQLHNQIKNGNIRASFTSGSLVLIGGAEFRRVVEKCVAGKKFNVFKRMKRTHKTIAE